jgi:RHS repeat-associated protein
LPASIFFASLVGRFRRELALTAIVTAWVLAFTLLVVPEQARAVEPAADETPVVLERPDQGAAFALARAEGRRVEVTGQRTEFSTLWANPDGTLTAESSTGPVRAKDASGEWAPLDTVLAKTAKGHFSPVNVMDPFTVSGGSSAGEADAWRRLVWTGSGASAVSWWWQGRLPIPTISGDTATFAQVAEGVDLRVQSTPVGFEVFVDVLERPAGPLAFPLAIRTGDDLSVAEKADGSFTVKTAEGDLVASSAAPLMWDADTEPETATTDELLEVASELVPAEQAPAQVELVEATAADAVTGDAQIGEGLPTSDAELVEVLDQAPAGSVVQVLAPDAEFMADPGTEFPVVVDPVVALSPSFDTFVQDGTTTDMSSSIALRLGERPETPLSRSFLSFNASAFAGKQVTAASLQLYHVDSATCTPNEWSVWSTATGATTATRWGNANQPTWVTKYATSTATKGYSSACDSDFITVNVKTMADDVPAGSSKLHMGLRSVNGGLSSYHSFYSSEKTIASDADRELRYFAPKLTVTYNSTPVTAKPRLYPVGSIESSGVIHTRSLAPRLGTAVSDPDGDQVSALFQVYRWNGSAWVKVTTNPVQGTTVTGVGVSKVDLTAANGFTGVSTLQPGQRYAFKAQGKDGAGLLGSWYSTLTEFRIDTNAPAAPTAGTCSYPAGGWTTTPIAGAACTFSTTDNSGGAGVAAYEYTINDATSGTVTNGVVPLTGLANGWHTVSVVAIDKAGNRSAPTVREFGLGAGAFDTPQDGVAVTANIPLQVSTGTGANVLIQYADPATGTWTPVPAAQMGGTNPLPLNAVSTGLKRTAQVSWNASTVATHDLTLPVRACIDSGSTCTPVKNITIDRVGNTTTSVGWGPGSLAPLTGNFSVSTLDVDIAGVRGGPSVSRAYNSFRAGTDSVFGKGWTASLPTGSSGWASLTDNGTSVVLTDSDQAPVAFTNTGTIAAPVYVPSDDAAGLELSKSGSGASTTFTLTEPDAESATAESVTVFTAVGTPPASPTPSNAGSYRVSTVTGPAEGTARFTYDGVGRPLRAAAPLANTATNPLTACPVNASNAPSGSWAAGCRDLAFTYNASNRIEKVAYRFAPVTGGTASSVDVACYTYNGNGQLTSSWDPRDRFGGTGAPTCAAGPVLATTYAYNAEGRLASLNPPGVQPFTIGYDGQGRAVTATRTHASSSDAEVSSIAYGVNIGAASTPADDTHPDLRDTTVALWGQKSVPVTAVAEFEPGDNPEDLRTGTIHAYDALGREVNTAEFSGAGQSGWKITTVEYDEHGNIWRTLSAGNRDLALGSNTDPRLVELGLEGLSSQQIATQLDQRSTFSEPDELGVQDEIESLGPLSMVQTSAGPQPARQRTVTTYGTIDYPTVTPTDWVAQGPKHSPIKTVVTARTADGADLDPIETRTAYALKATGNSANEKAGWDLRTPLQSITEMGSDDIVRQTLLDASTGNVIEQRQPSAAGVSGDPGTRKTIYYAAGAHAPANCVSDAWFGQVCRIEPSAQPSGNKLLVTSTTVYDQYLRPTQLTESTSGSVCTTASSSCRVATTTNDANGWGNRRISVATSGGLGTAVPTVSVVYDTSTGKPAQVTNSATTVAMSFDDFGRMTSYRDADDGVTETSYASTTGRVTQVAVKQPGGSTLATTSYGYGSASDFRGMATSVTHSELSGAITGVYDADGNLVEQSTPTGGAPLVQSWTFDTTGNDIGTEIVKDGAVFLSHEQASDVHGRVVAEDGDLLPWERTYTYDNAGRITSAAERRIGAAGSQSSTDAACLTRTYAFTGSAGRNGNRTAQALYGADGAGECSTAGTALSSTSYTLDSADRLSASGMVYDTFGRITTLPAQFAASGAAVTLGYHASDMVRTIASAGQSRTYGLDPAGNVRTVTATGVPAGTPTSTVHHYDGSGDSPTWTVDTSSTGSVTTRFLDGLAGDPVATAATTVSTAVTLNLVNLHGDIIRTTTPGASTSADGQFNDADEFGVVRDASDATGTAIADGPRYGWLGAKQRATDTGAGLMLMGVRIYAPLLGRFLQTDPVYGGNETPYGYPNDPVSSFDLSGLWSFVLIARLTYLPNQGLFKVSYYVQYYGYRGVNNYLLFRAKWYNRSAWYQKYSTIFCVGGCSYLRFTVYVPTVKWAYGGLFASVQLSTSGWYRTWTGAWWWTSASGYESKDYSKPPLETGYI